MHSSATPRPASSGLPAAPPMPAQADANSSANHDGSNLDRTTGGAPVLAAPGFLRLVLRLDALSCVACGLLQVAFTAGMARLLGLPAPLLAWTGEFLMVYAVLVAWLSVRRPPPRAAVGLLVAGNVGWALACCGLLLLVGGLAPTPLGTAYVVVQAAAVAVLAALQLLGLRASGRG